LYGPTGVGVLYGKKQWLDELPPYQYGGDMIDTVTFEKTTFAPPPMRFEAGTPPIAQVMGMGAAIDFIQGIGLSAIAEHESRLLAYAYDALKPCPGLRLVGEPNTGILSFTLDGIHPHDVGTILDSKGIAVRAGHHCAQPTMQLFNVSATTRASFGVYNTTSDVDALLRGIQYVQSVMT
jgi:cysteine desulfurase/selenocysteine lyase